MSVAYWDGVKRHSKMCKQHRNSIANKRIPLLREFCKLTKIFMTKTEHGYQFRKNEYVINWSPVSNKVHIQYTLPGNGRSIPFTRAGEPNKPRILIALEEVVDLVRTPD